MDLAALIPDGTSASYAELIRRGASEHHIRQGIETGELQRLRRGWYGRGISEERMVAGQLGGTVSCVSALRSHGVWTMPTHAVHVRVARAVARVRREGVVIHRVDNGGVVSAVDDLATAFGQLIRCASRETAVAAFDSALNRRLMRMDEMRSICDETARGRALVPCIDPASESGIESLARVRLRSLRLRVRTQVRIGSARVDLLVGERLVLELDGRAWHDRPGDFEADRARDRALVASGFIVLRASYAQVMHEWETVERQILALVRQRRHLWRSGSR